MQTLTTVSLYGRDFLVSGENSIYASEYEPYVFYHLMGQLGPGKTFLDVGANIGMFAVHAALLGAQVIAVEARPSNNALLLENARRAQVPVELHPLAVSDHHGFAVLDLGADHENAAIRRSSASSLDDCIVPLGILDELIGERHIDVLKIDVEGYEYRALLGARALLERCHPKIVTEYHPDYELAGSGVQGSVYLEYLRSFGYRFSILERSGEMRPAESFAELDDRARELGYHLDLFLEA